MNRISITGPFYLTHLAEIDADSADKLINGYLDKIDWRYEIQDLPSYQSLYGATEPEVSIDDELLFGCADGSIDQWVAKQKMKGDPMPQSGNMFLSSSCNLSDLSKDKYFYICCELCEGDEFREFEGDFEESKLSVRKATLLAGEEIATVYQINYVDSEIIDETESDYDAFYIFHDGVLTELD